MEEEDNSITMVDVLKEQEAFEEDAKAVLGASDDKNCTYSLGYVKRQALYACLSCCPDSVNDPQCRAGVCLACSLACHENHNLVELYTKRSFRCDCAGPKFSNQCNFNPKRSENNIQNEYNQNFSGLYCTCHRPYPDPDDSVEDEMIQCIICEDWFHSRHLNAKIPASGQYSEMICESCTIKNDFLNNYLCYEANYCTAKENISEQSSIYENVNMSLNEHDIPQEENINIESISGNPSVPLTSTTLSTELTESENVKQTVESDNLNSNLEEDNISKDADTHTLSRQNDEEFVNDVETKNLESLSGSIVSKNTELNTAEDMDVISKENVINSDDKTLETLNIADKKESGMKDEILINAEVAKSAEHTEEPKDTILMDINATVEPTHESTKDINKMDGINETFEDRIPEDKIDINSQENIEEPIEILEKNENEIVDDKNIEESVADIEIMEEAIFEDKIDTENKVNMDKSTKDILLKENINESIQDTLLEDLKVSENKEHVEDVSKEKINASMENTFEDKNNIQNIEMKDSITEMLEDKVFDANNEESMKDTEMKDVMNEITEDRILENKTVVDNDESTKNVDIKETINEIVDGGIPEDKNVVDNKEAIKDMELKDSINEIVEGGIPEDKNVVYNKESMKDMELKDSINEIVEGGIPEDKNVVDNKEDMELKDSINEIVEDVIPEDKNVVDNEEAVKEMEHKDIMNEIVEGEIPEDKNVVNDKEAMKDMELKDRIDEIVEDGIPEDKNVVDNEAMKDMELKESINEIVEDEIPEVKNVIGNEESMKDEKPEDKNLIGNEGSSENIEIKASTSEKMEDNDESTKNIEIIEEKMLEDTNTDVIQNQESDHLNQTDISKVPDHQENATKSIFLNTEKDEKNINHSDENNSMPNQVQSSSTTLEELSVPSSQNDQILVENEDVKMAESADCCNDSSDRNLKSSNETNLTETMIQTIVSNPEKSNEEICTANKGEDETDARITDKQELHENMEVDECQNTENKEITSCPDQSDSIVTGMKRKAEVVCTDKLPAMKKIKQENIYICIKPMCNKSYKIKGATFWPSDWRSKLCSCKSCSETYHEKKVAFILDFDDTVSAYEDLGKIKSESTSSQYEKGMEALSSLGHVQQINAITEYNKMKEKLLEFLKTFKDNKEIVKEEDIKGFFAGMKPKREPDGVYFCR